MECFTFDDEKSWLEALTTQWQEACGAALHERGVFNVALAGGQTPLPLYRRLAQLELPWTASRFFIGDERLVPPDHKESNYRAIYEAFYPRKMKLERWKTEKDRHEDAAADYERRLREALSDPPRLDLALLGIGDDGHIASLFPKTEALEEAQHLAVLNHVPARETFRLTVTYPLLRHARAVWFLARSPQKFSWIQKLMVGDTDVSRRRAVPSGEHDFLLQNVNLFPLLEVACWRHESE